jgi:outer membrane protein TolC
VPRSPATAHRPTRRRLAATVLCLLAACRSAARDPDAEGAAANLLGLPDALRFRTAAGPLDEPEASTDGSLPLVAAARAAVARDAALQAALADVRAALAEAEQARLLPNPVLDFMVTWGGGGPWIQASLQQDLLQTLTLGKRADAADQRLRATAATAVIRALDLMADLQSTYAAAQASDALLPMLRERLELLDRLLAVVRHRATAGEVPEVDVTALEAQRLTVVVDLETAARSARAQRLHLAHLLGTPNAAADWRLEAPTDSQGPAHPVPECVALALRHRPEVWVAQAEARALGFDLDAAAWDPWLAADAGIGEQLQGPATFGPAFNLPIPVFDTGAARRRNLAAQQLAARQRLLAAQRQVVEEVRAAAADLEGARRSLTTVTDELLPRQRQRRDRAELAYRAGQTDLTPLLLAEDDLREGAAKAIDLQQQVATARCRLQRAMGGPAVADGPTPNLADHWVR